MAPGNTELFHSQKGPKLGERTIELKGVSPYGAIKEKQGEKRGAIYFAWIQEYNQRREKHKTCPEDLVYICVSVCSSPNIQSKPVP